jgi:hypothetical protein
MEVLISYYRLFSFLMGIVIFVVRFCFIILNLASLVYYIQALGSVLIFEGYAIKHNDLINQYSLSYLSYILIYTGISIISLNILAIIGAIFKFRYVLLIVTSTQYFLLISFIAISLIIISILGIIFAEEFISALGSQKQCISNQYLEEANDAVTTADSLLCSKDCECKGDDALRMRIGSAYTFGSAKNIKDCDLCKTQRGILQSICEEIPAASDFIDQYFTSAQKRYFDFIKWLEQNFECAGVCVPAPKFLFTDVRDGSPVGSCRGELRKWVNSNILRNSIYLLCAGIFLLSNVILVVVLLFCTSNSKKYKSILTLESNEEESQRAIQA